MRSADLAAWDRARGRCGRHDCPPLRPVSYRVAAPPRSCDFVAATPTALRDASAPMCTHSPKCRLRRNVRTDYFPAFGGEEDRAACAWTSLRPAVQGRPSRPRGPGLRGLPPAGWYFAMVRQQILQRAGDLVGLAHEVGGQHGRLAFTFDIGGVKLRDPKRGRLYSLPFFSPKRLPYRLEILGCLLKPILTRRHLFL